MDVKRHSPEETKVLLESGLGYVYLDVRTVEEFEAGHVPGARNIPFMMREPLGMTANPHFVEDVQKNFGKDAKLVCGCQRGVRSLKAAQTLLAAGFTNVCDMRGGFGGETDQCGCIVAPGWATSGLPVSKDGPPDHQYSCLKSN
ncbi:MAG: rhodanese-like domain-containing protein [Acidobacteria bacterium]|nr:rhodanese-like domain-containing protein [Acidobacteriota bacterium]